MSPVKEKELFLLHFSSLIHLFQKDLIHLKKLGSLKSTKKFLTSSVQNLFATIPTMCLPIFSEEVAAGEGAFTTLIMFLFS